MSPPGLAPGAACDAGASLSDSEDVAEHRRTFVAVSLEPIGERRNVLKLFRGRLLELPKLLESVTLPAR
jgi:hypothetical protein